MLQQSSPLSEQLDGRYCPMFIISRSSNNIVSLPYSPLSELTTKWWPCLQSHFSVTDVLTEILPTLNFSPHSQGRPLSKYSGLCWPVLPFPSLPRTASLSPSSSIITACLSEYTLRNQNNSRARGLARHGKDGWTGAETQLLGLPQTWPFLSMIWVISSGPSLSNWDENVPFYLSLSAPLVSKVYLYPFGFVTDSEGKDKVKPMKPA